MITVLRRPVIKLCPHRDETDAGDLTIVIDGPAPELHQLGKFIDALAGDPISHEDFTAAVKHHLPNASITTTWATGPWLVEVRE